MDKTISHLNSKIWYRLLKVAFVFSFLVIGTLTVFLAFSSNYKSEEVVDKQNTKIICQLGNKKEFSQKEIFGDEEISHLTPLIGSWKGSSVSSNSDPQTNKILRTCEISDDELHYGALAAELGGKPADSTNPLRAPYEWELKYVVISHGIFTSLIYSLISLPIIAFIFEVIRRAFYYIILGTFKPKKE